MNNNWENKQIFGEIVFFFLLGPWLCGFNYSQNNPMGISCVKYTCSMKWNRVCSLFLGMWFKRCSLHWPRKSLHFKQKLICFRIYPDCDFSFQHEMMVFALLYITFYSIQIHGHKIIECVRWPFATFFHSLELCFYFSWMAIFADAERWMRLNVTENLFSTVNSRHWAKQKGSEVRIMWSLWFAFFPFLFY